MLGVIVTAHTTVGGTKMIFRYPPVIRDKVSQATLREFEASKATKAADDAASGAGASPNAVNSGGESKSSNSSESLPIDANGDSSGTGSSGGGAESDEATTMQFAAFGMPSVELASLLMPKTALCDAPFRVVVDNTKFVGHPTSIPARSRRRRHRAAAAVDAVPLRGAASGGAGVRPANNVDELSDDDEFDAHADDAAMGVLASDDVDSSDSSDSSGSSAGAGDAAVDGSSSSSAAAAEASEQSARVEITRVNIVFGLPISEAQESEYHRMAAQLGTALRHEEIRCNYLSRQLYTLLSIRERWLADVAATKPGQQPPSHSELYKRIVTESQLASELRHMYHSIRDFGVASLQFNNWINVFVSLRRVAIDIGTQQPLRPYQTLLLLDQRLGGEAGVDASGKRVPLPLPPDVSPRLEALFDACRPTKSFRALQLETQIPLSQLFRLAAHLVYWRKARVIHMLTKSNVYMLKPDTARWREQHRFLYRVAGEQVKLQADAAAVRKRDSVAVLCGKFGRQFPSFRLPETLERFSTPKPLVEHMSQFSPTLQRDFVNVVVWLLKHNLLEQMFVYVFLVIPPPEPLTEAAQQLVDDEADTHTVFAYHDPSRQLLFAHEADAAAAAAARTRLPSSTLAAATAAGAPADAEIRRRSLAGSPRPPAAAASAPASEFDWFEHGTPAADDPIAHMQELSAVGAANDESAIFAASPSPLYEYEASHIRALDDGTPQYRLLKRLCRYFRGTHHLEEIMWRENVERFDLLQVLDKYKNILVQCWQVDNVE